MKWELALEPLAPDELSSLPEKVLFRILKRDSRGRVFGTPRNPRAPAIVDFNPRIAVVSVGQLHELIVSVRHGIFPEQLLQIRLMRNDELLAFRPLDPISATIINERLSLTGGHHRIHEIKERILSGNLDPKVTIRILIHD